MMRAALLAACLLIPAAARASRPAPPRKPSASSTAAGADLPTFAASSAPVTLDLVAARFAEIDGRLRSLSARFRQTTRLDGSEGAQSVEGEVLFQRPNLLRLTHTLPERQIVVSDGSWLWAYRPAAGQVIKSRWEDWRRKEPLATGLFDFGHSAELLTRYAAEVSTVSAPGIDGHRTFSLVLTPKAAKAGEDFRLILTASTKHFFPTDAELRVNGAVIRSTLRDVRLNPEIPAGEFRFVPPPGADVFLSPSPS